MGKCRGSCWESVCGECGGCGEVWKKVWKSVGGDFFLEKCLGLLCNIDIALAQQVIVAIPN